MKELVMKCKLDDSAKIRFSKAVIKGDLLVSAHEGFDADVLLTKQQAAHLRDWLNEFLKEGE